MRYVHHIDNITVLRQDGTVDPNVGSFPFLAFLEAIVFDDRRATTTYASTVRWRAVVSMFRNSRVGDWIAVEDQDWVVLDTILQAPDRHFNNALMAVQLLPFYEAVILAGTVDPRKD